MTTDQAMTTGQAMMTGNAMTTDQAMTTPRLTQFSRGAGCGCKLSAQELRATLGAMRQPLPTSAAVRVGADTGDDAGVYILDDATALVQTVDVFTPVVDDPATWGAIAATNALSDVYAMGGRPVTALNIVGWPRGELPWELLGQVLDGAAQVLEVTGCALVGGHSIDAPEPLYGLAVTGVAHPDRLLTNAAGRPGDQLVLTKALGTGIATTAAKRGHCPEATLAAAVAAMTTSNATASEVALTLGVRCATDVTGFGLVGHLHELVTASGVAARLESDSLPALAGVAELLASGHDVTSGGTARNVAGATTVDWGNADEPTRLLASDAQTAGGLLLAVAPEVLATLLDRLAAAGAPSWRIGELMSAAVASSDTRTTDTVRIVVL